MPRATPVKKIKTRSIKDFFSPMKQTDSNRKVLQTSENVQNTESQSHTFRFRFRHNVRTYAVACDISKTVLDALTSNKIFRKKLEVNTQKDIVLQRSKGEVPRAAVKTDFPCCLIDTDEIIDVAFIIKADSVGPQQKQASGRHSFLKENLVTFYINTKAKGKVKHLMKNRQLWKKDVNCVCVYAFKDDILKTALKHDGRFSAVIFKKRCELSDFSSETIHDMSHPVKHLDRKHFLVNVIGDNNQPESQDMTTESSADLKENNDPNTQEDKKQNPVTSTNPPVTSTNPSVHRPALKIIPDSKETLKVLLVEIRCLVEKIKQRENLRNSNAEVQKFFRTEYDKSIQSFSEVKTVKEIMRLSNAVCQIRIDSSPRGTGFLLFNRFILTNAHVIGDFDPFTRKLSRTFTAVFGFEDLEAKEIRRIAIKENIAAYYHGMDEMNGHLDFALLELDVADEALDYPELLSHYRCAPAPHRGGICIVGHPDGGVKKMDPCSIIGKEHLLEAANKHISENVHFFHVITQECVTQKWQMHENQITYDSCFFHGSSGSPVFDEGCRLIGVHTGGYAYRGDKGKTRSVMEYGYTIQPALESIVKQAKDNGRADILKCLSEFKSLNVNLTTCDNDVEMTEEPQNQEEI